VLKLAGGSGREDEGTGRADVLKLESSFPTMSARAGPRSKGRPGDPRDGRARWRRDLEKLAGKLRA